MKNVFGRHPKKVSEIECRYQEYQEPKNKAGGGHMEVEEEK